MSARTIRSAVFFLLVLTAAASVFAVESSQDPLGSEIARWREFLVNNKATDDDWKYIQQTADPILTKAATALSQGRRFYALHLLAAVRYMLSAEMYISGKPSDLRNQMSALEAEWKKVGVTVEPAMATDRFPAMPGVPVVVQGIAQASYSEIRPYYEASLEYGRNTVADAGFFYLGSALGQLEFTQFCAKLRSNSALKPTTVQNLVAEMDGFEDELLAQYKPPASVDSHPMFIRISALLKGARELDAAGLKYGALYRYLDARLRFARLVGQLQPITPQEAVKLAGDYAKRVDADHRDHSIGRLFVEMALLESADSSPDSKGGEIARAVFDVVLPHYFAALEPPKKTPVKPAPKVKVTLVRWPYT